MPVATVALQMHFEEKCASSEASNSSPALHSWLPPYLNAETFLINCFRYGDISRWMKWGYRVYPSAAKSSVFGRLPTGRQALIKLINYLSATGGEL